MIAIDRRTFLPAAALVLLVAASLAGVAVPWRGAWALAALAPLGLLGVACLARCFEIEGPALGRGLRLAAAATALAALLLVGGASSEGAMERVALSNIAAAAMLAVAGFAVPRGRRLAGVALFLWLVASTLLAYDVLIRPTSPWMSQAYGLLFALTALSAGLALVILVRPERRLLPALVGTAALALFAEFAQYIVFWSGGRPDRLIWYLERSAQPWPTIAALAFALVLAGIAAGLRGRARLSAGLVLAGSAAVVVWRAAPETAGLGISGLAALLVALALAAAGAVFAARRPS